MLLLIATMGYVYHGVSHITSDNGQDTRLSMRRSIINEIVNQLNRSEIIGQSIVIGQTKDYPRYRKAISIAKAYVDSLRVMTSDDRQLERLDTVAMLMVQKEKNMRSLMNIAGKSSLDEMYSKEIDYIIELQDSLSGIQLYSDTLLVYTKSHTVANKPKNFLRRVREVFSPSRNDSVVVNDTIYKIYSDSIHDISAISDTITSILKDMQLRASDNYRDYVDRLNMQMKRLSVGSLQLNAKVQQLLNIIEDEDRMRIDNERILNERIRNRSAITISCIAVLSLFLAALFLYFIKRDITRSKHYRMELEKAKQHAEELLEAKEKLMLTITHDIKSPVGAILGYIELLNNIITGERQQFYLHNMQGSANHLLQLVTSLLDFHKLDADKMEQQHIAFNAKELFDSIVENNMSVATNAGLVLEGKIEKSLDAIFIGDPLRIRQIAENLLSNAVKFTSEGSVYLKAWCDCDKLHFSVADTGCGMSPDEQELIYKEFMRLPSAQGKEGFGLGLAITSKLIKLLGGEIALESSVGKGTVFNIVLPIERSGTEICATIEECDDIPVLPSIELLLIDDDRLQLDMTAALLAGTDVTVTTCTHPDELFLLLQQKNFDIMLTDIQMPAMNGIELISKVRNMPGCSSFPVIAMTARSDMDSSALSGYGFAGCLHKPFTRKELLGVLADAVHVVDFNFGQLTAFACDDADALVQIMDTFIKETKKKRDTLYTAMMEKDISSVTTVTHQLLPIFAMVGAVDGRDELEWFEARRGMDCYPDEADSKIVIIINVVDKIIADAGLKYK